MKSIIDDTHIKNFKMLTTSHDALIIVDADGHFLQTNPAFENLLGFETDDLRNRLFVEIVHKSNQVKERTSHSKIHHFLRSSELPLEMELVNKQGKTIPVRLRSILVKDSNNAITEAIGIVEDLREEQDNGGLEQKVWETQEMLQNILSNSGDAIVVCDINGCITLANNALLQLLGYDEEEIVGKHLTEISPYKGCYPTTTGEILSITEEYINHQVEQANELFEKMKLTNYELYLLRKDEILIPVEATCSILRDLKGKRRGSISICRDITYRKLIEKELQRSRNELEKKVEERTVNLRLINEQLNQEIAERKKVEEMLISYQDQLRKLASELSLAEERERRRIATNLHDCIGQSLAISKMKLGVLLKKSGEGELANALREIHDLIAHTIHDTRSLMFELMPPVLYELGLESALEELTKQFQDQHGITVSFVNDTQPKPLDSDIQVFLFQSVRELLINAIKHGDARKVSVTLVEENASIYIHVEDNGVGFNNSLVSSQVNKTWGFGLFAIRERLRYLGGELQIHAVPGSGTKVTIKAPLKNNLSRSNVYEHKNTPC